MTKTVCDTIEAILSSIQEATNDDEIVYKLRIARQLNIACNEQNAIYQETLQESVDAEILEELRELGYLETSTAG